MRLQFLLSLLAIASLAGACRETPSGPVELTVHAPASLREAFLDIERDFEAANPGVTVALNLGASQELRTQIELGAPADVFASADPKHLDALVAQGLASAVVLFACNDLVAVAPAGAPAPATFADLPSVNRIVVGTAEIPIGAYTLAVLDAASKERPGFREAVEKKVVSRELNVRQVLAKVTLGEADAAFVYRTDALSAGGAVRILEIPPAWNVRAEYPIAALTRSRHPEAAGAFVEHVRTKAGQLRLSERGFVECGPTTAEAPRR